MPTPDASAFTRQSKYNAIQERGIVTLYTRFPKTTAMKANQSYSYWYNLQ